jgi:hypothetical protein
MGLGLWLGVNVCVLEAVMHFNFLPSCNIDMAGVQTSEFSSVLISFNTVSVSSKNYATFGNGLYSKMWNNVVVM